MKYLIASLLGIMLVSSAHAADETFGGSVRSPEPATKVTAVKSSTTVVGISIATQTATSIIGSIAQMYSQACVQNLDTSAALYCGENSLAISSVTGSVVGTVVPPAASATSPLPPTCFGVIPGYNYYCLSGSVTAATKAVVIRVR